MNRVGVIRFPGTNCDRDVFKAIDEVKPGRAKWLWHADRFDATQFDVIVLPGGFSYGDYLRSGALAARAPAMNSVREAAQRGVSVLGICNGFQILCESGLLPGVLVRNQKQRFIDDWVDLELKSASPTFARDLKPKSRVKVPIAHADGRFHIGDDELKGLFDRDQVWWTYRANPNGAAGDIAGVMNEQKNVAALMPHPERAMHEWMGSVDGRAFFNF